MAQQVLARPGLALKAAPRVHGSCSSSFAGLTSAFQRLDLGHGSTSSRALRLTVEASRVCQLTGKKANNGYVVTFSHKRNKKLQQANLQYKRVYWPEGKRWLRLRLSAKAIKTIEKRGLTSMAAEAGIDLWSLPYSDCSKGRTEWLAKNEHAPALSKEFQARRMKNPEKLQASRKTPLQAKYLTGGRVILTRMDIPKLD